jgi:hypothetical protein
MEILVQLKWQHYGAGRILAKALSVDPATISRDINYLLKWRASFMKGSNESEQFLDAIIQRAVAAGIHPRMGYSWSYHYLLGFSSLTVKCAHRRRKN